MAVKSDGRLNSVAVCSSICRADRSNGIFFSFVAQGSSRVQFELNTTLICVENIFFFILRHAFANISNEFVGRSLDFFLILRVLFGQNLRTEDYFGTMSYSNDL